VVDGWWTPAQCRRLERLCTVLTGDRHAAADLAQETLLEAWRARDRLDGADDPQPWLDAVARNVCRRWWVRSARRHHRERLDAAPPDDAGHDPLGDLLERHELVELLERALALLPRPTRELLVARYVDERGPLELAETTGASPDAVSMRLARGRDRLRQLIETDLAEEPLAQIWLSRHGAVWRPTRMTCTECGQPATAIRRDPRRSTVELRCERCPRVEPDEIASHYDLDNPTFAPLLGGLVRPSALVGRVAEWSQRYWLPALADGAAPCTRCGRRVAVASYRRPEYADLRTSRGWHLSCPGCGEVATTSVAGLVLSHPTSRQLRARRPGLRAAGERAERREGRPVTVVSFRDPGSGEGVDAVVEVDGDRLALLDVRRAG
jgi:RNA polymerase sigma-70 factor (ECF subfamily)